MELIMTLKNKIAKIMVIFACALQASACLGMENNNEYKQAVGAWLVNKLVVKPIQVATDSFLHSKWSFYLPAGYLTLDILYNKFFANNNPIIKKLPNGLFEFVNSETNKTVLVCRILAGGILIVKYLNLEDYAHRVEQKLNEIDEKRLKPIEIKVTNIENNVNNLVTKVNTVDQKINNHTTILNTLKSQSQEIIDQLFNVQKDQKLTTEEIKKLGVDASIFQQQTNKKFDKIDRDGQESLQIHKENKEELSKLRDENKNISKNIEENTAILKKLNKSWFSWGNEEEEK